MKFVPIAGLLLTMHGVCSWAAGGIATDGTVGPRQTLTGPNFAIPQTLGSRRGNNLYHSFSRFNLQRGEQATFTGDASVRNVISRVTGGEVSTLNGTLRSDVGKADVYFINPAGIVFGADARVDVPAALHISTADALRLRDNTKFSAVAPNASRLSQAPPQAFGFTATSASNNGLLQVQGAKLEVGNRQVLDLSGRGLRVGDGARLEAPGGTLRLVSATSGERLPTQTHRVGTTTTAPALQSARPLRVDDSDISTQGDGGGRIRIAGAKVTVNDARVQATNTGTLPARSGAGVVIKAEHLTVTQGATISAGTKGEGDAGTVDVAAKTMRVDGGARSRFTDLSVRAERGSSGNAGTVKLHIDQLLTLRNSAQVSGTTLSSGEAGHVHVEAGNLRIKDSADGTRTGIFAQSGRGASGDAGRVDVNVKKTAVIVNGGNVAAGTEGTGNAGVVAVTAGELRLGGGRPQALSDISARAEEDSGGNGGQVQVNVAGSARLDQNSQISSSSLSSGRAGNVSVQSGGLRIEDDAGVTRTGIFAEAGVRRSGRGGNISLDVAGPIEIRNGGRISSASVGRGNAGNVRIAAGELTLDGGSAERLTDVSARADTGSTGAGGTIDMTIAGAMRLRNSAQVSTSTRSTKSAGSVTVSAGSLRIGDGSKSNTQTGILSQALPGSGGAAGEVTVRVAGGTAVVHGGQVSTSTEGAGNAGTVRVTTGQLQLDGGSAMRLTEIRSRAERGSSGRAGRVQVNVRGRAEVARGGQISSSTFENGGDGGSVTVHAGSMHVVGATSNPDGPVTGVFSRSGRGSAGRAGRVEVDVLEDLTLRDGATVSSTTASTRAAGDVQVQATNILLDNARVESATGEQLSAVSGNVVVRARDKMTLQNGASLSVQNNGPGTNAESVAVGRMRVTAPRIELQASQISAASRGSGIPAGTINLEFDKALTLEDSTVTTASNSGTGGDVMLQGEQAFVRLQRAGVTTSVTGTTGGNGGNITAEARGLLMDRASIRADTTVAAAQGGRIDLGRVQAIVPSQGSIRIAGSATTADVNVIQAAAPRGIAGEIRTASPQLNLSSVLANLGAPQFDRGVVNDSRCTVGEDSTLVRRGQGGLPVGLTRMKAY